MPLTCKNAHRITLRVMAVAATNETTNDAYERAKVGGMVDTAVGMPKSREEMYQFYEFIRRQTHDRESKDGLEFPAGYMFKDVPKWEELDDPVEVLLAEMERHDIAQMIIGVDGDAARRALRDYPDRFFGGIGIDPNEGMEAVRKIERANGEFDIRSVSA